MTVETAATLPEVVETLVKKIAKENGFSDCELRVKALDTEGDNYTSFLYIIDIDQDGKALNLFVKVTNTPENARFMINVNEIYKQEVFCYTELADAFDAIQAKHNIPEEQRYRFPKYYDSNLNELQEIIVLENLSKKDYSTFNRLKSIDWDYAKLALNKLATFHALSFALEREDPELFNNLIRSKKETLITESKGKGGEARKMYFKSLIENLLDSVESQYIPAIQKFTEMLDNGFFEQQYAATDKSMLVHGDYKANNLMVKLEEGKPTDMIPLDYQMTYYGSPINDLLYLLVTGTDETFRRQHYEDFLRHYHDSLGRALASLSHDVDEVYPRSLFYAHLKDRLLYCLAVGVLLLPMVLVTPGEQVRAEDLATANGDAVKSMINTLYRERVRGVVRDLVRWGALTV